ncbi:MAG: IS982 family transposase [Hormoscilla sp. GUM202]|nr:IS982 family transposase [Hormoscilla sp. GUM202]MBO1349907.1 IS982 family transposase [Hormoscilla sp. GUM202]
MVEHNYLKNLLSKSRFNRRLHNIGEPIWMLLFQVRAQTFKQLNPGQECQEYILDSFPVPVCDNIRIDRCKIYKQEEDRGYIASKKRYFYGLRVHMLVNKSGNPIEFYLAPGSYNDVKLLQSFCFDLPSNSLVYGDKAYNDYQLEDLLKESANIKLKPLRKKNSKRKESPCFEYIQQVTRKQVETCFSRITNLFPKSIHAVTSKGFELKIILFIIAFCIQFL